MYDIRKKSQTQEKRTAKEFKGRTTPASGALPHAKGDVRTGSRREGFNESDFLIENKFTDKQYYIFKKDIWDKISKEALRDNFRLPLLQIDIQELQLVVVDYDYYKEYIFPHIALHTLAIIMEKNSCRIFKKNLECEISVSRELGRTMILEIYHKDIKVALLEKDLFLNILRG